MVKKITFYIGLFLFLGCNTSPTKKENILLNIIDIDHAIQKDFTLSDFIDSIEYVYLKEQMRSPITKFDISDNYVIFYDGMDRILLFRRNGHFVKQISRTGKGPGEYSYIRDFVLDEQNNVLYALCETDHIFEYDLQGNFLAKIPVEPDTDLLALVSSGTMATHIANWKGNRDDRFIIRDDNGGILKEYKYMFTYPLQERHQWSNEAVKYTYDQQLHVKDKGDTLYIVTKDKMIPKYVFKNNRSIHVNDLTQDIYDNSFEFSYIVETTNGLYFSFFKWSGQKRDQLNYYYDKAKNKTYEYKKKSTTSYEEIVNDMDDGYEYRIRKQYNDVLITFRFDFDENKLAKASSGVRKKIDHLRENIKDEDPMFLVIMYLK